MKNKIPIIIAAVVVIILIFIATVWIILAKSTSKKLESAKINLDNSLFNVAVSSVQADAILCSDKSSLNVSNPGIGQNVCSDTSITNTKYSSISQDVCDNGSYSVSVEDAVKADGQYKMTFTCLKNGIKNVKVCVDGICDNDAVKKLESSSP